MSYRCDKEEEGEEEVVEVEVVDVEVGLESC